MSCVMHATGPMQFNRAVLQTTARAGCSSGYQDLPRTSDQCASANLVELRHMVICPQLVHLDAICGHILHRSCMSPQKLADCGPSHYTNKTFSLKRSYYHPSVEPWGVADAATPVTSKARIGGPNVSQSKPKARRTWLGCITPSQLPLLPSGPSLELTSHCKTHCEELRQNREAAAQAMSCNGLQAITLDVKHEWWDCSVRAQPMLPKIWLIRDLVKAMIANHHVLNHGPIIPLRLLHTHHLNQNRTRAFYRSCSHVRSLLWVGLARTGSSGSMQTHSSCFPACSSHAPIVVRGGRLGEAYTLLLDMMCRQSHSFSMVGP